MLKKTILILKILKNGADDKSTRWGRTFFGGILASGVTTYQNNERGYRKVSSFSVIEHPVAAVLRILTNRGEILVEGIVS